MNQELKAEVEMPVGLGQSGRTSHPSTTGDPWQTSTWGAGSPSLTREKLLPLPHPSSAFHPPRQLSLTFWDSITAEEEMSTAQECEEDLSTAKCSQHT